MHGNDGPLQINKSVKHGSRGPTDFLHAANSLCIPTTTGLQDGLPDSIGYEYANSTITHEGKRHDAATAYIHPKLRDDKHPNLHVLCETKVSRILFDGKKRAVGVELSSNGPAFDGAMNGGAVTTIKARRLVVASCGAIGSPLLLERSGLGSLEVLKKAFVPMVSDLPGVGAEYQDHNYVPWAYKTNGNSDDALNDFWRGQITTEDAEAKGLLAFSGCDLHGKLRPTVEEVKTLGPAFEAAWEKDFADKPGKPLMLAAAASTADPTLPPAQYFSASHYTAYPYSRGKVHITGPSLQDPIDFETGFFTDEHDLDLKKAVWAYKKTREIMRRTSMYRGEAPEEHPRFPAGSAAGLYHGENSLISQGKVQSLLYNAEDDKAIEQRLRERIATTWHSLGTCPMKPRELGGVVDQKLNVYGVRGLKVIDLSIPPMNVGANTQITAYTIGEKGADIIIKELGVCDTAANGITI
ncbi:hypothetical protein LTR78_008493 [Recurvomyces mirabilis]|uniref:Glucose-methanol-choline oxidoreductase N-terminal domain-containing protein n=1 Tax=Recurvomyces mirabilis TaxID=574656 RepID=A0AAE0TQD4_9PEZI|nr:hypothetical protein LTR78_008493 [Recurvomyces mirabilis]KAK5156245.1 hypothetical protein LTS14_005132 [Recurvomyces mirabilis]